MSKPRYRKQHRRYVVSDLGFAFAVHDTQAPQQYAFPTGKDKEHKSSNMYNVERVEVVPTREMAIQITNELNEKHDREKRESA